MKCELAGIAKINYICLFSNKSIKVENTSYEAKNEVAHMGTLQYISNANMSKLDSHQKNVQ